MEKVILTLDEYNAMVKWGDKNYAWQLQVNNAIHALEDALRMPRNPEDPPPPPWIPKP